MNTRSSSLRRPYCPVLWFGTGVVVHQIRVAPVFFSVDQVVDQVDAAGEQTEGKERAECLQRGVDIAEPVGKEQRREDEEVLDPLVGS